jgi:hypothetical protein
MHAPDIGRLHTQAIRTTQNTGPATSDRLGIASRPHDFALQELSSNSQDTWHLSMLRSLAISPCCRRMAKLRGATCNRRPRGRHTGCAPFFDAAGCRIEKSRPRRRRQIRLGTKEFSWVTFFSTKKVIRVSARKLCCCFSTAIVIQTHDGYRCAQPILQKTTKTRWSLLP